MSEKRENKEMVSDDNNPYYGTFQGVTNCYPPSFPSAYHQQQPYHFLPVYAVPDRPLRERRLPCCGLGVGWLLFIIGWFLGGVPWYIGTFVLVFVQMDHREKPGLIACALASSVTLMVVALGVTQADLQKLI
ncbi:60S ribosomal protein L18a-like protein [Vigna radiata var. radiata]|uniref:60S ribosomal protein L18a-like protein n=1 Tax=Vigna radiata var. radiata TaxID=3916 RepID=A0A1S3VGV1_VIGRR|nr:60S ribosomal protein L18a-like protein [Vigna radiata var. radiata]